MQVELRHLRVLSELAEAGSITRAAAKLGVSQPTLSAQLDRIEQAFGGRLFGRSRDGIQPTALGRHVLARARSMIAEMDDLLATARNNVVRDDIRLGCFPTVLLGALLKLLETELPHREVTTSLDHSGAVLTKLLANDQVDIVLMGRATDHHAPSCPPGVAERVIAVEPCGIALPSTHPLAAESRVSLADLSGESWIPPQGGDDGGAAVLRAACEAAGFTPLFRYRELEVTSMAGFVAAGLAVALVAPTWIPAEGVTVVALDDHTIDSHRVLRWRTTNVTSDEVDAFHRCHHHFYRPIVERHTAELPWLSENPDARPTVVEPDEAVR